MKRVLSLILIAAMIFIVGCTLTEVPTEPVDPVEPALDAYYPLTITDSYGREVTIEAEPVKVVSIAPSITETVFALGKGDLLVGRTDYCDYPSAAADIASIGSLSDPNIETITEINPDLIIASTHFKEEVLNNLETLGFTVLVLYGPETFDGAYETIGKVAQVLNANEEGNQVITEMKSTVADVLSKVKGLDRPSLYYVVGFGEYGDYTATGETFISQMIEMAGGENIAKDATGWSYNLETLVENDPEIIVCSEYFDTKATFEATDIYKTLSAVNNGKLFTVDNNKLDRQGPRVADGLLDLAKLIHPEAFE